jgi:putative transposase
VGEILKARGINPGRRRTGPTWPQFLRSQTEAILACNFFTAGLLDGTQAHVLAVIEHATRRIHILGVTLHPTGQWTAQQARNLLMDLGDQAHRVNRRRWHPDRACSIQTRRMNAIAERWTADAGANSWTTPSSETRPICGESRASTGPHHNQHRPHRFLNGAAPLKPLPEPVDLDLYRIRKHAQVGGLINEYHLVA